MANYKKRIIAVTAAVLATVIAITVFAVFQKNKEAYDAFPDLNDAIERMAGTSSAVEYDAYIERYKDVAYISDDITAEQNVVISEGDSFTFAVNINECLASVKMIYKIVSDNDGDGTCSIDINGERPFREAAEFTLKRSWLSADTEKDKRGNEYTVSLNESDEWQSAVLTDNSGLHTEPLCFYFAEGENNITITAAKGSIELKSVMLYCYKPKASYNEISKNYTEGSENNAEAITIEAEKPYIRTNASITELCDRTSAITNPVFEGLQVWNSLGGSGWSAEGQSVSWKFHAEKSGYYTLAFRFKNNFTSGLSSYRRLLIDGEVPFSEMESVKFPYGSGWQVIRLADADGNPYLYFLEEGDHTITLEVTLGEQAKALNVAQKSLFRLNEAYRRIIMVTGATPDKYRDYQIEKNLPDVLEIFKEQKQVLQELFDWLLIQNGGSGEGTAKLDEIIRQLNEFLEYPETLPQYLSTFNSNLTGLSDWIQSCTSQPLTVDCIQVLPKNADTVKEEAGFFKNILFGTQLFFKSFAEDYGMIGSVYGDGEAIEVWLTLGRDQYQIIKELTDNDFTPESNIGVSLKLVSGGILQATVAGIEPDVYLFADEGMPMNFAARGALLDLSEFPDYSEVAARFYPQAMIPYTYDGGVYGIPLTQVCDVMFVRDDILTEIGLEVPETWEDVYNCLTVLQQNNMEFAYPDSGTVNGFALLLFQNQSNIYKDNGRSVDINTEEAIEAFTKWTELYSDYSLLMSYNFVNRFRSGDMPIGIADFSTFNTLEVSAPEISGLWSMYPVPGTRREDGSVRHISLSTTTAAMIMNTTENPEQAWSFVKWFTGADAQYAYAAAIENKQGISGRYATANIEAFGRLSWSAAALSTLNVQRENAMSIEQVPGGYFLNRHINNIFRKIINEDADVRETVNEYTQTINAELTKKRREFGLETDS